MLRSEEKDRKALLEGVRGLVEAFVRPEQEEFAFDDVFAVIYWVTPEAELAKVLLERIDVFAKEILEVFPVDKRASLMKGKQALARLAASSRNEILAVAAAAAVTERLKEGLKIEGFRPDLVAGRAPFVLGAQKLIKKFGFAKVFDSVLSMAPKAVQKEFFDRQAADLLTKALKPFIAEYTRTRMAAVAAPLKPLVLPRQASSGSAVAASARAAPELNFQEKLAAAQRRIDAQKAIKAAASTTKKPSGSKKR